MNVRCKDEKTIEIPLETAKRSKFYQNMMMDICEDEDDNAIFDVPVESPLVEFAVDFFADPTKENLRDLIMTRKIDPFMLWLPAHMNIKHEWANLPPLPGHLAFFDFEGFGPNEIFEEVMKDIAKEFEKKVLEAGKEGSKEVIQQWAIDLGMSFTRKDVGGTEEENFEKANLQFWYLHPQ